MDSGRTDESVLIVGVNWLGDSIMTMPAIQAYRHAHPDRKLVMLVKPKCRDIWSLHADIDEVMTAPQTVSGTLRFASGIRDRHFNAAFVLPHSFRSALIPFLARIPIRTGLPGHWRDRMLTRIVRPESGTGREHQCHEYMHLFGLTDVAPGRPVLAVSDELRKRAVKASGDAGIIKMGLMPGAAYGPSKRWPEESFAETGRLLHEAFKCAILVLGSESERDLCGRVAKAIGEPAVNMAGRTSLPELAAVLSCCAAVVSNDSGGMHLASALGIPVAAVFGITDPARTGPIGEHICVLQDSSIRCRDLKRESRLAETSLRRISPQRVFEAVSALVRQ